jgi:hypothetical protein
MRALAAAIQDGRAQLHLTVDELAERSGITSDDIWRLLGEDLAVGGPGRRPRPHPVDDAPASGSPVDRKLIEGLAQGLHRDPEVLFRAALIDAGLVDAGVLDATLVDDPDAGWAD